jgi:hypothetical protein
MPQSAATAPVSILRRPFEVERASMQNELRKLFEERLGFLLSNCYRKELASYRCSNEESSESLDLSSHALQ